MLKNNKGMTLIEVLIASSIIIMLISTIIPISTLLLKERNVLNERQIFIAYLHDELQTVLFEEEGVLPQKSQKEVKQRMVTLSFVRDDQLIKGCIQWENVKKIKEKHCLYGKRKK